MGLGSKSVTIVSAMAGLAVFSQAPEFAQQYRQRIGGAVEELKTVVVDFDKDASRSELSRNEALDQLVNSQEKFAQDRGNSMTRTITRFERLDEQRGLLENSHPLTRPLFVLKYPDQQLLNGAWEIFEPAVPLTSSGALYGGLGAFLAVLLARIGIGGGRAVRRRKRDKVLAGNVEEVAAINDPTIQPNWQFSERDMEKRELLRQQSVKGVKHQSGIPNAMQVSPGREQNVSYLQVVRDHKQMQNKPLMDDPQTQSKTRK